MRNIIFVDAIIVLCLIVLYKIYRRYLVHKKVKVRNTSYKNLVEVSNKYEYTNGLKCVVLENITSNNVMIDFVSTDIYTRYEIGQLYQMDICYKFAKDGNLIGTEYQNIVRII